MSVLEIRHARFRGGIPAADMLLLALPEAQPVIKRIGEALPPDYPDRMDHALRVAAIAVAAEKRPRNRYAKATL